jgi:hypothetical protein
MARGGTAGARLAARRRLPTSAATLLGRVRAPGVPPAPALPFVGVDEGAWRRGHSSGTIRVDRAPHRVVDLLPDRSTATIAVWLAQHPTLTGVCRARRALSADGMRRGAPHAVHVGERLTRVQNLRQTLDAWLSDHRSALQAAALRTAMALTRPTAPLPITPLYRGRRRSRTPAPRAEAAPPPRHARGVALSEAVHALRAPGTPLAAMARRLGLSRPTVDADLRRDTPPGPRRLQRRPSARVWTPSRPYLIRRWRDPQVDRVQLWRELQVLGSTHAARTGCRVITQLRRAADAGPPPESQGSPDTRPQGPAARALSLARISPAPKRSPEAQTSSEQRCQRDAARARAPALSDALLSLVRERRGADLKTGLAAALASGSAELARVARGLQDELTAVTAGLPVEWRTGVTAGPRPGPPCPGGRTARGPASAVRGRRGRGGPGVARPPGGRAGRRPGRA